MSKLVVISNSGSGRASELDHIRALLSRRESTWVDLASEPDLTDRLVREIITGDETIVAAGGDGTVNAVVNAMMAIDAEHRASLAILPLGTANDFAGTLGIPDDLQAAIRLIDAPSTGTDIVRVIAGGRQGYYANMAAGGNCVRVSEAMTDEVKSRWGALSYMRGAVDVLPNMTSYKVDVVCGPETLSNLDLWAILVANGKTNAGGIEVAPDASTSDGLIDVILIRDGNVGDMVEIVANNLAGSFLDSPQVIFRQVESLRLQSEPTMRFTFDGEVIDEEPVRFEVVPAAIQMHAAPG